MPSALLGGVDPLLPITKQSFITLCRHGWIGKALQVVSRMAEQGKLVPTSFFYHLLVGCAHKKDLDIGREVHGLLRNSGLHSTPFLGNHLIRMYDSCGNLSDALKVAVDLTQTDVFVWTSVLSAHSKHGNIEQVFHCFHQMHELNVQPDGHAFVASLKACVASKVSNRYGHLIHAHIIETGHEMNLFVNSALTDMYTRSGDLEDGLCIFRMMPDRNVVLWSTMIMAYAQCGSSWEALSFYKQMQFEGTMPDLVTFINILKAACTNIERFEQVVKVIHVQIIESSLQSDVCVINTLIDVYAKVGDLVHSRKVFEGSCTRDVVTWSAMIGGYVQHGCATEALYLFNKMQQSDVEVDRVTCLSCLKACSSIGTGVHGKLIHCLVIEMGLELDVSIGNALIDLYTNSACLEDACKVFDSMSKRDVVTWTTMILGHNKFEQEHIALVLFSEMLKQGVQPDDIVFIGVLKACGSLRSLQDGKLVNANIVENSFEVDIGLNNTLIDMYSNCWSLEDACKVFSTMPKQDTITWNAMIAGCFQCNRYELAWRKYEEMQHANMEPDNVTFLSLLSGCSNQGLVVRGYDVFKSMREYHGLEPTIDHCNCIADLLGRIGDVEEAEDVLKTGESGSNIIGWTSLLSHCRAHSNMEVGLRCFHRVVVLDPKNSKGYILMSNIFANAGRLHDAEIVEQLRYCGNAWNKPGNAFIMIENKVHSFLVGEQNHLSVGKLKNLSIQMLEEGYMPSLELAQTLACDDDMHCCFD